MAEIVQSFTGDKALRLKNEEFVRRMSWGSDWRRLHLAVNHSIPAATGDINNAIYYIGLCSGTTNTLKNSNTTEWLGCWVGGVGTYWTYSAGPPASVYQGGSNYKWGYKQGTSLVTVSNTSVANYVGVTNRDYWNLIIEHTANGYMLVMRTPNNAPGTDIYGTAFRQAAGIELEPIRAVNYSTSRQLDCVSIWWTDPNIGLEISELLVIRLA